MGKRFNIFEKGKEQKLLKLLYGNEREHNEAFSILRKDALKYCFVRGKKLGFTSDETSELYGEAILAFCEAYQKQGIDDSPSGYLKRIIKNKSIDKFKKKKGLIFVNTEQIELSTVEDEKRKEIMELNEAGLKKVLHAIENINPLYKTLIQSYYF